MLRMKSKTLIILSFFLLTGCNFVLMKIYGIKKPGIENEKSIIKQALKYKLDTTNIVTVSSKNYFDVLKGKGIPDAAIYDKDGKYIEYRQTDSSCNAALFQFIPELSLTKQYTKTDSLTIRQELNKFRNLKGYPVKSLEKADFYVLIYWTVWAGRLNKDHVKIWEDLANNNQNCNIKVIKVNLDIQEYWDEQEREKIIQAMSKKKKK